MAGEGFMAHANQSLKMNKRSKGDFLAIEEHVSARYDNQPLVLQKASFKKLKELEAKSLQLKEAEAKRLKMIFIGWALLSLAGLITYFFVSLF